MRVYTTRWSDDRGREMHDTVSRSGVIVGRVRPPSPTGRTVPTAWVAVPQRCPINGPYWSICLAALRESGAAEWLTDACPNHSFDTIEEAEAWVAAGAAA